MRKDYVNFFWTGNTPSQALLRHLVDWQKYLIAQQSDFQVRLWVTQDIYDNRLGENSSIARDETQLLLTNDSGKSILIETVEPLLTRAKKEYPLLTKTYETFLTAKLYSFCSSFIRMLILNDQPGFYCDVDIYPRGKHFPKSLEDIIAFISKDIDENTNPIFGYFNGLVCENQVMLTVFPGAFRQDLSLGITNEIKNLDEWQEKINKQILLYQEKYSALKKIIQSDPFLKNNPTLLAGYLKSYLEKNALSELTKKSDSDELNKQMADAIRFFEIFFMISTNSMVAYEVNDPSTLQKFNDIIRQTFRNPLQDKASVYAWSNPIHFHLREIEKKIRPLQSFFRSALEKKYTLFSDFLTYCKEKKWSDAEATFEILSKKYHASTKDQVVIMLLFATTEDIPDSLQGKITDYINEHQLHSTLLSSPENFFSFISKMNSAALAKCYKLLTPIFDKEIHNWLTDNFKIPEKYFNANTLSILLDSAWVTAENSEQWLSNYTLNDFRKNKEIEALLSTHPKYKKNFETLFEIELLYAKVISKNNPLSIINKTPLKTALLNYIEKRKESLGDPIKLTGEKFLEYQKIEDIKYELQKHTRSVKKFF